MTPAAATVAEAIKVAEQEQFDVLVSDIGLPDGTGRDAMRHVRQPGMKGIALSGFGQQEDITRRTRRGWRRTWSSR